MPPDYGDYGRCICSGPGETERIRCSGQATRPDGLCDFCRTALIDSTRTGGKGHSA